FAKQHDYVHAQADLRAARELIASVGDVALKRYEQADIDVLLAELPQTLPEAARTDRLRDAIAFFSSAEPARLPRLYLALAREYQAMSAADEMEQARDAGITQLEAQHGRLGDEALKISYLDDSWTLFPVMVTFQLDVRRNAIKAFSYAERSRARSL